ncbi:redoxin domain-containing protein [Pedobacter panaciterrae]|uniref:peroxiredoxin family protein n=1 Tax=Pedobacter panaciterrae TaxID=363849 RepID=UPI00155DC641|nr:thioredoxin-like domain-containing protein [Pedobacter panaciterrae]NQX56830.1 redoxin domain-containing protein [Pedobacter panaciterrae]
MAEENPNYIANYKKYKVKGLEILGVTLDKLREKDKWMEGIRKDGLLWPQVGNLTIGNLDVSKLYNITAIPQNYLLDPGGRIIASDLRGEELGKKLAEIFDK